jgi:energy-coupling factor transporter ATP-binding protein EcfA2
MSNYITSIHVNHIFHLKDLDIPVSTEKKQHLLLTGKNGSGKTLLMNAMMEFIEKIYADKPLQFLDYDKTLKSFNDAYSGDIRSPIPVISVHSVGNLQYRRQS